MSERYSRHGGEAELKGHPLYDLRRYGGTAVMIPALKADAGRMLPSLPTPTATRYTLPVIAARTTDGGRPVTRA